MSIYSCIERGSVEEVGSCFQEHAGAFDIAPPLPYKKLPVHLAIRRGRTELIEVLHDINYKWIDLVSAEGETPISLAARHGNLAAVKLLIELGCSQNQSTSPLIHAITAGNNDMIRELVAWNPRQLECGTDLLSITIFRGHLSTLELLVELIGLDKLIDSDPLTSAVYWRRHQCLPLLFRLGFSVDQPCGNTNAIWYSANMADTIALKYLVDQGGRGQEIEIPLPMPHIQHGSETVIMLVRLGFRCFKKRDVKAAYYNNKLTLRTLFALLPEYLHYYEGDDKDYYHRCLEDEDFSARTRSAAYFTESLVVCCLRENNHRKREMKSSLRKSNLE